MIWLLQQLGRPNEQAYPADIEGAIYTRSLLYPGPDNKRGKLASGHLKKICAAPSELLRSDYHRTIYN